MDLDGSGNMTEEAIMKMTLKRYKQRSVSTASIASGSASFAFARGTKGGGGGFQITEEELSRRKAQRPDRDCGE